MVENYSEELPKIFKSFFFFKYTLSSSPSPRRTFFSVILYLLTPIYRAIMGIGQR